MLGWEWVWELIQYYTYVNEVEVSTTRLSMGMGVSTTRMSLGEGCHNTRNGGQYYTSINRGGQYYTYIGGGHYYTNVNEGNHLLLHTGQLRIISSSSSMITMEMVTHPSPTERW